MALVLVYDLLQLTVFATDFSHILRIESHLLEVNQYAPSPVLKSVLHLDLYPNESAWLQKRTDIFRECHYLVYFSCYLVSLVFQFSFLFKKRLVRQLELLESFQTGLELGLDIRKNAFILKLMKALHDNVFRP